jgi:hypothetical protein
MKSINISGKTAGEALDKVAAEQKRLNDEQKGLNDKIIK